MGNIIISQGDGFIYVNIPKTYDDAEVYCQNTYGTNLASIHNAVEHNHAMQSCAATSGCWIGLNDKLSEASWVWNDQSLFDYSNWKGGEPNNNGGNEDCVMVNFQGQLWNDGPCHEQRHFLCNRYIYVDIAKTADDAEIHCREQYDTNLASIPDSFNDGLANSACLSGPCWIGLNDKLSEGSWVWNDHSLFDYNNWSPGEPSNNPGNEDCVMILAHSNKLWNDGACNIALLHFLCNAAGSPTAPPTTSPTPSPTSSPTLSTPSPTPSPSPVPTSNPTAEPTVATNEPTSYPTNNPTVISTVIPTTIQTNNPTSTPTNHIRANTNTNIVQTVQKTDNSLLIVVVTICIILGLMLILCVLISFKFLYKNNKKHENEDEPSLKISISNNATPSTNIDTDNFAMTKLPKVPSLPNMNALTPPGLSEQDSSNIEGDDDINDGNSVELEETQSGFNEDMYENPEGVEIKGDTLGGINM